MGLLSLLETTTTTVDMATFLADMGVFFTQSLDWTGSILNVVVASPPLSTMVVGMPIVGFAYGLLGRLFRL